MSQRCYSKEGVQQTLEAGKRFFELCESLGYDDPRIETYYSMRWTGFRLTAGGRVMAIQRPNPTPHNARTTRIPLYKFHFLTEQVMRECGRMHRSRLPVGAATNIALHL